jgi:hypothetical protein
MLPELKALLAHKEPQGQVLKVPLVHKAAPVVPAHKELQVIQEHKVPLDLQEPRARPVLKGLLVVLAVLVPRVQLVVLAVLVLKAPLAVSAIPKVLFTVWFLVVNYTTLNKKGSITWQPQI